MTVPARLNLKHRVSCFLDECKTMKELKQIHAQVTTSDLLPKDTYLISRLLFFCAISDSGCLNYANTIFRLTEHPNLFFWNTMIRGHARTTDTSGKALYLYRKMLWNGMQPDRCTLPFVVKSCSRLLDPHTGKAIHAHAFKIGLDSDPFVQNTTINMYALCGFLQEARQVFDEICEPDIVSWNSIIAGYLKSGALDSALYLFRRMKERNVITWNSMITGLVQGGRPKEALAMFQELQLSANGVEPDKITMASVVSACASLGALDHGKWVHGYLQRRGLELDMVLGTALVDMYGKCGSLEEAMEVFRDMSKKDVLAWTAMITGLGIHGFGEEALGLLAEMEMEGTKPNHVTFVGLLCACTHAGLVEKGRWCFDLMKRVYRIKPQAEHYACMVDLLGRAGLFEEAEALIRNMPMEPDVFVWGALLGGCGMHGKVELGERVAQKVLALEPLNHAFYVLLSNMYARANRFEDAKRVWAVMKEKGIKKRVAGCSMIELDGHVYEFSVQETSKDVTREIEGVLNGVGSELALDGYLLFCD